MGNRKGVSLKDVTRHVVEAFGRIPNSMKFGWQDFCPHCGYYCTGKTAFCTKHPSASQRDTEQ